jgi:hypothetical protein
LGGKEMLITENQLDEWSRRNSRDAQGTIVELVWRLVAASCPKPKERRFPLSDSIGQHGPDGILEVAFSFEPFIPDSRSYWEIGAGLDPHDKATKDYKSLTEVVPEHIRLDTTFIFVTPLSGRRGWEYSWKEEAQAPWLEERRKKGEWKNIQIIDGTRLVDWLKQFPAVEFWLAQKIGGIPTSQIEIPTHHWSVLSSTAAPPLLTPELFLSNRDEAISKLDEVFNGSLVQLKLTTHYVDQVIDFVAAYLASLDSEAQVDVVGRCLVVSGAEAWSTICNQPQWKNHILIADASLDLTGDAGSKLIQKARGAGHAVISGGPHGGIPDTSSVPLPAPLMHQIQESLKKAGYKEGRARALAQKSGGNLSSLLRCIQNLSVAPAWAERSNATDLAIAVILGSWSNKSEADRIVVEKLSAKAYGEWIRGMQEMAVRPDTPLIQRDGGWKFIARYEGWYWLGPHLYDDHLDRFREIVTEVFREIDPKFDLPPDQRFAASVHGKVLAHSRRLRNAVAETLALLGSHPDALQSCSLGKAEMIAALTIREIFSEADWYRWASLNDLLPLLAEASPREFLDAVDKALQKNPSPFDQIFAQEGDSLFGGNYLTGLLWALETLAWDANHLTRAVICLGELAERDPGGQSGNRPANSLKTIFLPWAPQTCASVAKRTAAIKTLLMELPKVGWKLLISLLPDQHSVSFGSRKPAWRVTISDEWRDGVSIKEYWEQVNAYAELVLNQAKKDASKLAELADHLENLPNPARAEFLEYIASDSVVSMSIEERLPIWNKLVDLVSKHRKFADAKWAMQSKQVDEIESLAERLAPDTPFFRHQRFFSESDHDLFEEKGDYEKQVQNLEKRRQDAVSEVAGTEGVSAVLTFAKNVKSPWRVGISYGTLAKLEDDKVVLPHLLEQKAENESLFQFVGGYVRGKFYSKGWEWVDGIQMLDWTAVEKGQFLAFLPFDQATWERVKKLLGDDQSPYWSKTSANPYETKTGLDYAVDQLLRHGRPHAALGCLQKLAYDKQPIKNEQAVKVLMDAIKLPEKLNSMDVYEIVELIKFLQEDTDTNPDDLFQIEWGYLQLLDGHRGTTPKLLWQRLGEDPKFFCEVIQLVFRSKKPEASEDEVTEERRKIATNAYHLLSEWRRPPGQRDDGLYDGDAFKSWINIVKKECLESGHLEIALIMVGHVLIYAPPDPDGLWMHRSVAEVLNAKDAEDIRDGFRTELYNSRGVHSIDPTGNAERELAKKYSQKAEAIEDAGYHRLAIVLRDLAKEYEYEAQRVSSRDQPND